MRIDDVNKFKGIIKNSVQKWLNAKVDELLAGKSAPKAFLKNGINNILAKYDKKINDCIDMLFLFVADEKGVIDSDRMVDTMAGIFKEMQTKEYNFGMVNIRVGKGESIISLPQVFLLDMLLGDMGSIRLTTEDILEFKNLIV